MLYVFRRGKGQSQVTALAPGWTPEADVVWIDLVKPTREEEVAVETALGVDLPTIEEMQALEPSSRLYQEHGATFMTSTLIARSHEDHPFATPATFVLSKGVLVTLRYENLRAFTVFGERAAEGDPATGAAMLMGLWEAIVERLARTLDDMGDRVEDVSTAIFHRPRAGNFRPLLTGLAQAQSVTSLVRNSLVSLSRALSFAGLSSEIGGEEESRAHLESLKRDVQSLTENAGQQSSHIAFLLDAALGLITIEQNGIIKFFSVAAVAFMPPTLIASIYGMNFAHMPELAWMAGYPFALLLMVVAGVVPVLWFKQRGWL
ncbi:MAG: magnesium transporter CorA family protein [Phenylobacterium sp.]|uniref:magnesium transporter CorA family protein n=1 Tax=Phenylobacterium sp. TaxID=1871053 RepID=UPI001A42C621|nr:magnesium transporter CorA family protein [Phenylobacterium sp.]MBL8771741.1 magnesium transporter CorA family protein [Phenylobacterium sp.]